MNMSPENIWLNNINNINDNTIEVKTLVTKAEDWNKTFSDYIMENFYNRFLKDDKFKDKVTSSMLIGMLNCFPKDKPIVDLILRHIDKVIINYPATIVVWKDGTKTVVKCDDDNTFDEDTGVAMCIVKKMCGNKGNFNNIFKKVKKQYGNKQVNNNTI